MNRRKNYRHQINLFLVVSLLIVGGSSAILFFRFRQQQVEQDRLLHAIAIAPVNPAGNTPSVDFSKEQVLKLQQSGKQNRTAFLLIIAVFIVSRRADHRQVAKLALPSGIFQINEPILFGLPIIMNPVMFIPFVLIQPLLAGITLTAYYLGIIPPVTNIAPWTMPAGLGAFFNTNGSVAAFLLAIFNLGIATLLYMPFVAIANKAATVIDEEESEEDIALALKF